ncbi:MAG TPA: hypothetical protein VH575_09495 [Gemmataceae bacterium]
MHPLPPAIRAFGRLIARKLSGKRYISHAARFEDKELWTGTCAKVHRATTAAA